MSSLSRLSVRAERAPAQINGHPEEEASNIIPAGIGARAAARLRGTFVTLAAAARSSGGTTAITYDWRAGTSICDSDDRNSRKTSVSLALGIMAASIRKALDGRCVYTIVLIRPIRAARATDTNCDNDPRRPAAKKKTPAAWTDMLKRRKSQSASSD